MAKRDQKVLLNRYFRRLTNTNTDTNGTKIFVNIQSLLILQLILQLSKVGKSRDLIISSERVLWDQMFPTKNVGDDNFIVDSNVTIRFKLKNLRRRDKKTYR